MSKKSAKEELLPFKILNEKYHMFESEDGSIISAKFVLIHIVKMPAQKGMDKSGYYFQSQFVTGVWALPKNRGERDKSYTTDELAKFIEKENLMFKQIQDGGSNLYETDEFNLLINYRVKQIDKTSKFDSMGVPAYIIRSESEVLVQEKPKEKKE